MKTKVIVTEMGDGTWSLVNEAGQSVECDFATTEEAESFAEDNGMDIVNSFFVGA
jgi:hypothetical protein